MTEITLDNFSELFQPLGIIKSSILREILLDAYLSNKKTKKFYKNVLIYKN